MRKTIYVTIGFVSLALGILGIFIPGLPTTPFLLLTSWLFYKGSRRMHDALHRSRWLGKYIRRYESKQGVSLGSKLISVACMWAMISISAFYAFENWHVRILLFVLGIIGTVSIFIMVPTCRKTPETGPVVEEKVQASFSKNNRETIL